MRASAPYDEDALLPAICFALDVTKSEGVLLATLLANAHSTLAQLSATSNLDATRSRLSQLKKKLEPHGIRIRSVAGLGCALDKSSRNTLRRIIAGLPQSPPIQHHQKYRKTKPEAEQQELSAGQS